MELIKIRTSEGGVKSEVFKKIVNFCLLALTFLVPLFFLPFTFEVREFNKQALIILLVLIMAAVWVIRMLATKSLAWVRTSLDYILGGFILVYLLSSIFSIDKVSSFLGYYSRFTGSFIVMLALVILYFIVANFVRSEKMIQKIAAMLNLSFGLVIIYGLLQIFGWFVVSGFGQNQSFNSVGTLVSLSLFAVLATIFFETQLLLASSKLKKILLTILIVLALILVFMINAFISWLVLGVGMLIFIGLGVVVFSDRGNWFWKALPVLVISLLFVAFQILPSGVNPRNLVTKKIPVEVQLSYKSVVELAKNSLTSGTKTTILGSGPGTTGIAFGQIKSSDFNKTIVWSLNFDSTPSEFANLLIETGLLGTLVFELMSILFLFHILFLLLNKHRSHREYIFGFFLVWVTLYLAHFLYSFNTTFYFIYFLFMGVVMAITHGSEETLHHTHLHSTKNTLTWIFTALLLLALILVGGFFETTVYASDLAYTKGLLLLNQSNPDLHAASQKFARALSLNNYRDNYYLVYAQSLLFEANAEAGKEKPDLSKIQNLIQSVVLSGKKAVELSPNKASNWSALAQIYNAIKPFGVSGTDQAAIGAWEKAIERDDKNPILYVQLSRSYINASQVLDFSSMESGADSDKDGVSDSIEQRLGSDPSSADTDKDGVADNDAIKSGFDPKGRGRLSNSQLALFTKNDANMLDKAVEALSKSILLKNDLPDSYIALARVYERANKLSQAKTVLDEAALTFPSNPDILFEQGRITFNQGDATAAEKIFNNVIALNPQHADALFSLGLLFQQKGDKAKALELYEKTRELTGPTIELDARINNLKQ